MFDWQHSVLDGESGRQFVEDHFSDFLPTYDRFRHDEDRANALKYMWLQINGGLVIDANYILREPIDRLFYSDAEIFLLPHNHRRGYYATDLIASKAGHIIWTEALDKLKKTDSQSWFSTKHWDIARTTGCEFLTELVSQGRYPILVLPIHKINSGNMCHGGHSNDMLEYVDEVGDWDYKAYKWCYCNSTAVIVAILVIILVIILVVCLVRAWSTPKNCYQCQQSYPPPYHHN
jgi:hypothetical protein